MAHWQAGGLLIIIDGLWWAGRSDPANTDAGNPWHELWKTLYSTEVQAALPLMHAQSLGPAEALVRAAGFADVALERLERSREASNHKPQTRFLLRGRRPASGGAV